MQNALTFIHPKTYPNGRKNRSKLALARTDDGSWQEQLYRLHQFLEECDNLPPELQDVYFSLNGFSRHRRIDCLVQINCFFVDIDPYALFFNLDFIREEIEKLIPEIIPRPGLICNSGRGLWLIWPIVPLPREALMRWKRIQEYLLASLSHLGADLKAKDVTRVIRMPNSINSKSGQRVSYEMQPDYQPLDFRTIEKYLPPVVKKPRKASKPREHTQVHPKFFNPFSLNLTIIEDLKRLADLRKRDIKGHREYFLFIWRNCLAQLGVSPEDSERQLRSAALQYLGSERLPDREWTRSTLSAHRARFERSDGSLVQGYKLKTQWIIDALAITPEEQTKMQFLIGTAEKYDRKNKRRSKKQISEVSADAQKRYELIRQAKEADPELSIPDLMKLFKASRRTVYRALQN